MKLRSLATTLAVLVSTAAAQPEASSDLLAAVARAPVLEAARKRIDAASVRAGSAGRIADPEVEAMGSRVNADAMGENRDMWELSVRQPLPRRGERAADRDRAVAAVAMAEAEFAMIAGELAADVALAIAEAEGADARARLLETQLGRMQAVIQALDSRIAAGLSPRIAGRLNVQTRIAALQLTLEETQRTAADARAGARARLALAPDAPLPAFAAPLTVEINPTDAATVAQATARIAAASAMGKMARASAHPMTSVGLRFERERSSMGNQDTVGLALSSEIPWRSRQYARADVRAAEADRAAAQADASAARHRIASTISRVERAERVAATARRLAAETQRRLDAEHDALTRAASANATGGMGAESAVLHAIDILDKATETQLQIVDAETTARAARAELWRFVSASRLLSPPSRPQPPAPSGIQP
ncbi:MAG: TolC family protein [Opitutaceae bacterium]|nr:TolC family protein [Opitutaceae bacterium]